MEYDYFSITLDVSANTKEHPEKVLFLSVILQALLDATKTKSKVESSQTSVERERARAWFFCSVGVTCENFENVCHNAGLDPSYTRSFAYEVINSKEIGYVRQKIKRVLDKSRR
jgi:hypothetical protein|tara:strand:- start:235 stop:576 length:342 start_codon:yes stop_codon:yes gene_type:complete